MTTEAQTRAASAAKVAAVNAANAYANQLHPVLTAALAPFMGCKVVKVDGALLKTVQEALPAFPNTVRLSVYRNCSDYSLSWTVKTCESYEPSGCVYHETSVYVGVLNGATLESWNGCQWTPARTDHTAAEVLTLRAANAAAKKAASDAQSALFPFGEYDR